MVMVQLLPGYSSQPKHPCKYKTLDTGAATPFKLAVSRKLPPQVKNVNKLACSYQLKSYSEKVNMRLLPTLKPLFLAFAPLITRI